MAPDVKTGVNLLINHTVNTSIMPAKRPVAACGPTHSAATPSTWHQSERHPETPYYKLQHPRARMFGCFNLHNRSPHCHIDARGQSPAGDERAQVRKLGANATSISDIEPANCAKAIARPRHSIGRLRKSRSDVNIVPPQSRSPIMLISICPPPNTLRTISGKATVVMPMKKSRPRWLTKLPDRVSATG